MEKAQLTRALENAEIQALVKAIGTGVGDAYDHDRLRYDKIILMADADVDGGHITTLLLRFFYRLTEADREGPPLPRPATALPTPARFHRRLRDERA